MDTSRPKQLVQLAATLVLLIGLFLPVIALRYRGNMSLFSQDPAVAILLLVVVIVAGLMALRAYTTWVPLLGAIAGVLVAIGIAGAVGTVNDPTRWPQPGRFAVLEDRVPYENVEATLRWGGWIVMLLGAAGLAASYFIPAATEERIGIVTGPGRYRITGYEQETGTPTTVHIQADNAEDAENRAVKDGIIVTDVAFDPVRKQSGITDSHR